MPGGAVRMLLVRFAGGIEPPIPPELELSVRERNGETLLLEHRGDLSSLLRWLAAVAIVDIAIGTEDLRVFTTSSTVRMFLMRRTRMRPFWALIRNRSWNRGGRWGSRAAALSGWVGSLST